MLSKNDKRGLYFSVFMFFFKYSVDPTKNCNVDFRKTLDDFNLNGKLLKAHRFQVDFGAAEFRSWLWASHRRVLL